MKEVKISELSIGDKFILDGNTKNIFTLWGVDSGRYIGKSNKLGGVACAPNRLVSKVEESKTSNDYQKGFEAGRADYKTTVLSLERRIEELKRALELASVDNEICYHCGC